MTTLLTSVIDCNQPIFLLPTLFHVSPTLILSARREFLSSWKIFSKRVVPFARLFTRERYPESSARIHFIWKIRKIRIGRLRSIREEKPQQKDRASNAFLRTVNPRPPRRPRWRLPFRVKARIICQLKESRLNSTLLAELKCRRVTARSAF